MKAITLVLKIDLAIQAILLFLIILAGAATAIAGSSALVWYLLGLFVLVSWQTASGIGLGFFQNDITRGGYVVGYVLYFLLIYHLSFLIFAPKFLHHLDILFFIIFLGIIPFWMAMRYFNYTQTNLKELKKNPHHFIKNISFQEILDSEEVLKNH